MDLPPEPIFDRGYHSTTNNRMELRACIEALKFIASEGPRLRVSRAVVYTDSQYVCDGERTPILRDVDKRAKKAALAPTETDYGYNSGTVARKLTPGKIAATAFPARGQSATIRIYGIRTYKARGVRRNRIVFDVLSETSQDYAVAHFAWVDAQETIHRNKCYDVRFNVSETYPQIVSLKELSVCPERKGLALASSAPASAPPAGQGQSA